MNRDDIIRMAREAGCLDYQFPSITTLGRFAALVAEAEREACAKSALDEPEPVAWINYCAATGRETIDRACHSELASTPLYEGPPQRKPLTEEKMRECAQAMNAEPLAEGWPELVKFARAIEQTHGIGGGDE